MRLTLPVLLFLAACQQVPSRSSTWMPPLAPEEVEQTPDADGAEEDAAGPEGDDGDDREDGAADLGAGEAAMGDELDAATTPSSDASTDSAAALMAKMLGEELPAPPADAATPADEPAAREVVAPGTPNGWGISLISTLPRTTPPRAILALSNGDEIVVEPGSFVPSESLVVMAVGADGVRVAHVVPDGDHATIHTETLAPLYRSRPAATPAPTAPSQPALALPATDAATP